ncbi:hypothetical protein [Microbacterium plantarum]|uniref:hypothetical protein n=1 Tax=Microbacterium plantarum TaxID=1816425 RepID=UPI002B473045|nr:hypothetical protein [Microbacterium plantarum]WRK17653.1 hypothetical protein VC184_01160 [Microbacterium plantarum]
MKTGALIIRSCVSMLAIGLMLVAAKFLMAGLWVPGLAALALAAPLAIWFWQASKRALADEALRASEDYDATDRDT